MAQLTHLMICFEHVVPRPMDYHLQISRILNPIQCFMAKTVHWEAWPQLHSEMHQNRRASRPRFFLTLMTSEVQMKATTSNDKLRHKSTKKAPRRVHKGHLSRRAQVVDMKIDLHRADMRHISPHSQKQTKRFTTGRPSWNGLRTSHSQQSTW